MATVLRIAKVNDKVNLDNPFINYDGKGKRVSQFSAALVGAYLKAARERFTDDELAKWVDIAIGNTALSTDVEEYNLTALQGYMNSVKLAGRVQADCVRSKWFDIVLAAYCMAENKGSDDLTTSKILQLCKDGHLTTSFKVTD